MVNHKSPGKDMSGSNKLITLFSGCSESSNWESEISKETVPSVCQS